MSTLCPTKRSKYEGLKDPALGYPYKELSLHPWNGWAQDAPLKGAGISNIEYRLHVFRSGHLLIEKEGAQRFITSIFNIPCSTFDILLMNRHRIGRTF